jgi:hypothetical protein
MLTDRWATALDAQFPHRCQRCGCRCKRLGLCSRCEDRLRRDGLDHCPRCPDTFQPILAARLAHYERRAALELELFEDVPQP